MKTQKTHLTQSTQHHWAVLQPNHTGSSGSSLSAGAREKSFFKHPTRRVARNCHKKIPARAKVRWLCSHQSHISYSGNKCLTNVFRTGLQNLSGIGGKKKNPLSQNHGERHMPLLPCPNTKMGKLCMAGGWQGVRETRSDLGIHREQFQYHCVLAQARKQKLSL